MLKFSVSAAMCSKGLGKSHSNLCDTLLRELMSFGSYLILVVANMIESLNTSRAKTVSLVSDILKTHIYMREDFWQSRGSADFNVSLQNTEEF